VINLYGYSKTTRSTEQFRVTLGSYAPSTTLDRHDHEQASICLALSGGYDESLGRRERRVDTGMLVVHPEGEAHADRHDPRTTTLLTIEFSSVSLDLARHISPVFDESWDRTAPFLLPSAYRLLHDIDDACALSDLLIEDLIWSMIADAIGYDQPDACRPAWLLCIRDCLEARAGSAPPLAELSEMAGVHPIHLARAFRQAFGCSIGVFVRRRQVASALSLLADSPLDLAEVSLISGFADQSHMTRRVREMTGRPPGAWRKWLTAETP